MKKLVVMPKNVLVVCVTFLIVSCSSCKKFEWEARPYVVDSVNGALKNAEGKEVSCKTQEAEEFTCFDEDNITELIAEIDKVNSKKTRAALKKVLNKAQAKREKAAKLVLQK